MPVTLSPLAGAGQQFFDNNGNPLTGGKLYTYSAGTTTPLAAYTTNSGAIAHTNPIILDSAGRVPSGGEIWLTLGVGYKFVLATSTDVVIATYDNIPSSAQPPAANDADSIQYEQGYTVTAGSFVGGRTYRILTLGSTDFTLIGATSNTVGVHFVATGAGTGTGTAEYSRTVEVKLRESITPEDFGAVGNGIADDTVAVAAAVNSSSGKKVICRSTYRITSKITVTANNTFLEGPGTISIDVNDDYAFAVASKPSFEAHDLNFIGNGKAKGVVDISGCDSFRFDSCKVYDFYTATFCIPIRMVTMQNVSITNTNFEKIRAFPDGIIGNTNGVVTCIYAAAGIESAVIDGCTFRDINNYSGSVKVFEDADAISFAASTSAPLPVQNAVVTNCYFEDVGKRAFKANSNTACVYTFENAVVVSSWTGATDALTGGMYSVASHYGGSLTVKNVTLKQGICSYFVDSQVPTTTYLNVDGCYFEPEYYLKVRGNDIAGFWMLSDNSTMRCVITNNYIANVGEGIWYAPNLTCVGNKIYPRLNAVSVSWGYYTICDNVFYKATTDNIGIYFITNRCNGFVVANNHITGFNQSIYYTAQSATTYGSVTNNVMVDYGSSALVDFNNNNVLVANNYVDTEPAKENIAIITATAANIASAANAINTINKRQGKMVYDTTNNRVMIASGALAVSAWYVSDGSTSVVPV